MITQYNGLAKVIGVKFQKPSFNDHFTKSDLKLYVSIAIRMEEEKLEILEDLNMSIEEYGEPPTLGDVCYVLVKNGKLLMLE